MYKEMPKRRGQILAFWLFVHFIKKVKLRWSMSGKCVESNCIA